MVTFIYEEEVRYHTVVPSPRSAVRPPTYLPGNSNLLQDWEETMKLGLEAFQKTYIWTIFKLFGIYLDIFFKFKSEQHVFYAYASSHLLVTLCRGLLIF